MRARWTATLLSLGLLLAACGAPDAPQEAAAAGDDAEGAADHLDDPARIVTDVVDDR